MIKNSSALKIYANLHEQLFNFKELDLTKLNQNQRRAIRLEIADHIFFNRVGKNHYFPLKMLYQAITYKASKVKLVNSDEIIIDGLHYKKEKGE